MWEKSNKISDSTERACQRSWELWKMKMRETFTRSVCLSQFIERVTRVLWLLWLLLAELVPSSLSFINICIYWLRICISRLSYLDDPFLLQCANWIPFFLFLRFELTLYPSFEYRGIIQSIKRPIFLITFTIDLQKWLLLPSLAHKTCSVISLK